jgi:penicillin-binding protein 2
MKEENIQQAPALFIISFGVLFTVCFLVLVIALFRIQVRDVAEFAESQAVQAVRTVQVPGLRGRILDRKGRVLADVRPGHDIVCHLEAFRKSGSYSNTIDSIERSIDALSNVLALPRTISRTRIERHLSQSRAIPLVVWRDVNDEVFARYSENASYFPGFSESIRAERVYPYGSLASHVIGYTGRDRPDSGNDSFHFYEMELKGRSGIEGMYNSYLSGVSGVKQIRVDARGFRPLSKELSAEGNVKSSRVTSSGPDLSLTIDAALQSVVESQLEGLVGAAVVLDPRNGEVLAIASSPTYNLNDFVPLLSKDKYKALSDDPRLPLLNRAVTGLYAPGSTFKPITALAALAEGWNPSTQYDCRGVYILGNLRLHCWDRYGHGKLDLREAINNSCNSYFCHLGREAGTNAVVKAAYAFGLGKKTGIDLFGEAAGIVPDGTWKRARFDEPWYQGDTCQMSIGQGMLLVTPLQMAVVASALANGGKIYKPFLHARDRFAPSPEPVATLPFKKDDIEYVRRGMRDVVEIGTGRRVFMRFPDQDAVGRDRKKRFLLRTTCAAKTGTAEIGRGDTRRKNTWVIAFAPYDVPTMAVAMIVERGDSGGKTVAPKIHNIFASVFGEDEYRVVSGGEMEKVVN